MSDVSHFINILFGSVMNWFNQIFNAIPGSVGWLIAIFAMYSSFRFLIFPIVGGKRISGSDNAKKTGSKNNGKGSDSSEGSSK